MQSPKSVFGEPLDPPADAARAGGGFRLRDGGSAGPAREGGRFQAARGWWGRLLGLDGAPDAARPRTSAELTSRSYRHLARRTLADFPPIERSRKIVICSAASTTFGTDAMLMLAYYMRDEVGCRVLLVDDLGGEDTVGQRLGLGHSRGVLDYASGGALSLADVIQPTVRPGISVLPAGLAPPDGLSPIQLQRIPQILEEAGRRFHYVLVQQTAILDDSRSRLFVAEADLALVVVREGETSMNELDLYNRALYDADARDVRLILCSQD